MHSIIVGHLLVDHRVNERWTVRFDVLSVPLYLARRVPSNDAKMSLFSILPLQLRYSFREGYTEWPRKLSYSDTEAAAEDAIQFGHVDALFPYNLRKLGVNEQPIQLQAWVPRHESYPDRAAKIWILGKHWILVHVLLIPHPASVAAAEMFWPPGTYHMSTVWENWSTGEERCLRIPCGLLKQLFCFSLPFSSPIVPSSTTMRRVPVPKSRPSPSLHQLARAIISLSLSLSLSPSLSLPPSLWSKIDAIPNDRSASKGNRPRSGSLKMADSRSLRSARFESDARLRSDWFTSKSVDQYLANGEIYIHAKCRTNSLDLK